MTRLGWALFALLVIGFGAALAALYFLYPVSRDLWFQASIAIYAAVIAVAGSCIGGWIGAQATREAMQDSIAATENAHQRAFKEERHAKLGALVRELRLNIALADDSRVQDAWVPFQAGALHESQVLLHTLPPEAYESLQEARLAMSKYNTLANYVNSQSYATDKTIERWQRQDEEVLKRLAQEAKPLMEQAATNLARALITPEQ